MAENLTASTVHGMKWSYVAALTTMVLQIGVTALLARLLTPSAFGLVAMAGVVLWYGSQFAMMGVGSAVVQKPKLDTNDIHTAFTSSLLMGLVFCGVFIVLAPLADVVFPDTPGVVTVTRVMSLGFVISGLTATTEALLHRRFAFRAAALTRIGSYVVGYALVGVSMALLGFGVWSLVISSLLAAALVASTYLVLCRKDIGLRMDWSSFKALYSFGGRVSLISFGQALATTLDTLWAGHYLGAAATGLYTRATNLATVPLNNLVVAVTRVLLSGYSRMQNERDKLRSAYLVSITLVAAIGMPFAWGMAAAASQVVLTLLGSQWTAAIPVLAILSLAAPFTVLTHIGAVMCEATATLNVKLVIVACRLGWFVALLALLGPYGIVGIAIAFASSEFINHIAYLLVMRRMFKLDVADLWRAHSVGLGAGIITGAVVYALGLAMTAVGWLAPITLTVQVVAAALLLVGTITRARQGELWREIQCRLDQAGYRRESQGAAGWVIRRIDSLSPQKSAG